MQAKKIVENVRLIYLTSEKKYWVDDNEISQDRLKLAKSKLAYKAPVS